MIARRTTLKRYTRVRRKRSRPTRGPERSPEYLAWIRTLPCAVCHRSPGGVSIEAAHTSALGPRGISQKSPDYSAVPLCTWRHRAGPDSYHRLGERSFEERFGIKLTEVVSTFHQAFRGPNRKGSCTPYLVGA